MNYHDDRVEAHIQNTSLYIMVVSDSCQGETCVSVKDKVHVHCTSAMAEKELFRDWRRDHLMDELTKSIGTAEEIQQEVRDHADEVERNQSELKKLKERHDSDIRELQDNYCQEKLKLQQTHKNTSSVYSKIQDVKKAARVCVTDFRDVRDDIRKSEDFMKIIDKKIIDATLPPRIGADDVSTQNQTECSQSIESQVLKMIKEERQLLQKKYADLHSRLTQYWVLLCSHNSKSVDASATRELAQDPIVQDITALLTGGMGTMEMPSLGAILLGQRDADAEKTQAQPFSPDISGDGVAFEAAEVETDPNPSGSLGQKSQFQLRNTKSDNKSSSNITETLDHLFNPYACNCTLIGMRQQSSCQHRSGGALDTCKSCDCVELGAVTMSSTSWFFTEKYYLDNDRTLLGQGGSSVAVER